MQDPSDDRLSKEAVIRRTNDIASQRLRYITNALERTTRLGASNMNLVTTFLILRLDIEQTVQLESLMHVKNGEVSDPRSVILDSSHRTFNQVQFPCRPTTEYDPKASVPRA